MEISRTSRRQVSCFPQAPKSTTRATYCSRGDWLRTWLQTICCRISHSWNWCLDSSRETCQLARSLTRCTRRRSIMDSRVSHSQHLGMKLSCTCSRLRRHREELCLCCRISRTTIITTRRAFYSPCPYLQARLTMDSCSSARRCRPVLTLTSAVGAWHRAKWNSSRDIFTTITRWSTLGALTCNLTAHRTS